MSQDGAKPFVKASSDKLTSAHPIIEVRKWDQSGVLGRHLSPFAIRVVYAITNFVNRETGRAWPSLETLNSMVQVHRLTLKKGCDEIARLRVPLQRVGRRTGVGQTGRTYLGSIIWDVVPFDQEQAEVLLKEPPRRKRRSGRFRRTDSLPKATSEISQELPKATPEASDSLHNIRQRLPCVDHELDRNRVKTNVYTTRERIMPSSTSTGKGEGKGVEAEGSKRVRGVTCWTHSGKPLLAASHRMRKQGARK